jgi:TRAP-type mannitol/chloroaromatic compound transport system permease small subunit
MRIGRRSARKRRSKGWMMQAALAFTRLVDELNRRVAVIAIWLVLLCSMLAALNAFISYGILGLVRLSRMSPAMDAVFGTFLRWYTNNSNSFLEAQVYMFCAMVMLGAPWVLKLNEHVRVDLLYGSVSERARTWIDLIFGVIFLLPFCIVLLVLSWPYFLETWRSGEVSVNAGGLPIWPFTIFLPIGFSLLLLQAVAELIKCVAALTTDYHREHAYEKPVQ